MSYSLKTMQKTLKHLDINISGEINEESAQKLLKNIHEINKFDSFGN